MVTKSKAVIIVFWMASFLGAGLYSAWDSLLVFVATSQHPKLSKQILNYGELQRTELKRQEQKYFLDFGVYVPLDDMMFFDQLGNNNSRYERAIAHTCGSAAVDSGFAIWLPLRMKWPLLGERVFEWCWRPMLER